MSTYVTANPTTGVTDREFPGLADNEIDGLAARSLEAFESWRRTEVAERAAILSRTADLYEQRADELASTITTEMGKPAKEAAGEVQLAADIYRWYADHGPDLLVSEELDPQGAESSIVQTAPIGPLLGVMPWNYPYYQVARFAAPNLLAGNTIVLKHASICAASSALMAEILHDAGVPQDVYANVYASSNQVAELLAHPAIRGVSLTGSEGAGAAVAKVAAENLKKSVLELGGSDPFILLDSADMARTTTIAARARLSNAGQACNSPKRFIVLDELYDDFVQGLVEKFEATTVGDPGDSSTRMGPLSSISARDTVADQVKTAVDQGATLRTGGAALDRDGAFFQPTVLTDITPDMDAYAEEIFGPVAMVYKVSSADEAVALANDVEFGLSGSVWSTDTAKAEEVADRLEVGMAYVNEHGTTLPGLPFGGVKRSGYGRELGRWGLGEFVNTKLRRTAAK
ncbi:NAD-dependent succinate-semialdehyde dehydrogenase [Gordonia alkanivorans]|uniref:NAD-dependent succinate-semialdehyde dehydrogenase n=1 Tax=Gordonia alkanivorans TaxID=84096 RepID=UPI002447667D|nr:NAD-dependent succinate-semialdehyde dehydrogenase [Gordonia alkanivorans]MDH3020541.1 NAD-dependent succinate-semialdehyde dehydrogenase [Gordonia alkanivorans]MDH3049380.1 NAD-dependent succinate-semialdehyde dehydrogenase [Gordonia alkanivorans]MDJ0007307.1 NAD-dependent succinate-semialdehyde dehydrogenase [Gordonia alkanivorans]MDJ0027676.1 NAD-dependent succinate-semialdehyde dehydrogenase [Gordonia alkanivorans]MDJ0098380.1 NAD-dependent succinate-semialdehyde dehydrogenase [Gordonia